VPFVQFSESSTTHRHAELRHVDQVGRCLFRRPGQLLGGRRGVLWRILRLELTPAMKARHIGAAIAAGIIILGLIMLFKPGTGGATVTPAEAQRMMQNRDSVVLLDVRTAAEHSGPSGHLEGSLLIPVQELEERIGELEQYRGKTIIAYCRSGNRSGKAATVLNAHGFRALNMTGGMIQWSAEQRPVVRGETP